MGDAQRVHQQFLDESKKKPQQTQIRANVKCLGQRFNGPYRGSVQERNADTNALKELLRAATTQKEAQVLHSAWLAKCAAAKRCGNKETRCKSHALRDQGNCTLR